MVTVSRTICHDGCTITETVTASLSDNLVLDDITEASRRLLLAELLFSSLPSLQPQHIPHKCKPTNLPN